MPRFNEANVELAREIVARYPVAKSATIPLCHLAQEQDGYLTTEAMEHVAELVGTTAADVLGTASFYEMFKMKPVGRYVINVCTSIACFLSGGDELLEHAEETLGIKAGGTTADGLFTLEGYECIAACTEAPCLQVNYRYVNKVSNEQFEQLIADLRAGRRTDEIPDHGILARIRQALVDDRRAGNVTPEQTETPVWIAAGGAALRGENGHES